MFSNREAHEDSGHIESIIRYARSRIFRPFEEVPDDDVVAELMLMDINEGKARNAIAAARILGPL